MSNKRLTCITMFDTESLSKLNNIFENINIKRCKLKYKEINREEKDKLPFHATICVWKKGDEIEVKSIVEKIIFNEIELTITGTKIKSSSDDTFNLYFEFEKNENFTKIQEIVYEKSKIEKYNPNLFVPHITIHIDKNYSKIIELQKEVMKEFKPFKIKFKKLGLYEIYPPKKII